MPHYVLTLLTISILLCLTAVGWAVALLVRFRDWRIGFLAAAFAALTVPQVVRLARDLGFLSVGMPEVLVFQVPISVLSLLAVTFLGSYLADRQRAVKELFESRQILRLVLNHIPQHVFWKDRYLVYQGANRPFTWESGSVAPDEMIGKSDLDLPWRASAERFQADDRQVIETDAPKLGYEEPLIKPNGTQMWLRTSKVPMHDPVGNVIGVLGSFEDITERKRVEESLQVSERHLAADLEAMIRLQKVGTLFVEQGNLQPVLDEVLSAAIAITDADMGNIQLLDEQSRCLRIVSQRGFEKPFLDFWNTVHEGEGACGTAFREGVRVLIEDVKQSPIFAGKPALDIMCDAGVRAVQSTLLLSRSGKLLGVFSTHFRTPHRPDDRALRMLDLLARQTADIVERSESEAAMREADSRLRLAVSAANVGLWDWDLKTNKVHFSPEWKRQIGYEEHEISDDFSEWQSRCHPDDLEPTLDIVRRYLADPWPNYCVEFRLRHKDGSYRSILAQASLEFGADGRPVRMLGSHVDITDRKQVEAAMRESELHFRLLFEQATDGIFVADTQHRIVDVNFTGCDMLGYSREELLKLQIPDILAEDEAIRIGPEAARLAGGDVVRTEWRFRRKDGSLFFGEVAAKQLPYGHLQGFVRDITERKRVEAELRENQASLETAQEQARLGSWEFFPWLNSGTWTKQMYRLFDRDPELGPPSMDEFLQLVHPADRMLLTRSLDSVAEGTPGELNFRNNPELGPPCHFHCYAETARDKQGRLYFSGTLQDITAQKQSEIALRCSERELHDANVKLQALSRQLMESQESERRRIARELHDEIGQVLTAVKISLQQVLRTCDPTQRPRVEEASNIASYAVQQVRDLSLNLRPPMLDDFGLAPAIEWLVSRHVQPSGCQVQLQVETSGVALPPDVNITLYRAAQESLTNILRHAHASHASIELRQDDDSVHLIVRDDGVGFDIPTARERARLGGSMGILSMQERLELLGGQFQLESAPGRGTTVRIGISLQRSTPTNESGSAKDTLGDPSSQTTGERL